MDNRDMLLPSLQKEYEQERKAAYMRFVRCAVCGVTAGIVLAVISDLVLKQAVFGFIAGFVLGAVIGYFKNLIKE